MMSDRRAPRSLGSIVATGSGALNQVVRRSEALMQMQRRLRDSLPAPLREHCQVANVRGRSIIVYVDSAAWATQLRFLAAQVARTLGGESAKLVIRVRPAEQTRRPPPVRTRPRLSPHGAETLQAAAESVSDPLLAAALRRLASRRR